MSISPSLYFTSLSDWTALHDSLAWGGASDRYYDIYLGIVMIFDATDGNTGNSGHVHCRLAWSPDALTNWSWVDPGELGGKGHTPGREFIPAGPEGSFDSHVCFAAHMPLKMPDGSSRIYYMGGNGPHSGAVSGKRPPSGMNDLIARQIAACVSPF
eukprot:COSAG06_NODE_55_length_27705_cov_7.023402_13_plen_156_part_00